MQAQSQWSGLINMKEIGLVILAVEESSRLEKSLQLLNTDPAVFLQDIIFCTGAVKNITTVVVLRPGTKEIEKKLAARNICFAIDKNWRSGLPSTIITGLESIISINPDLTACIFTVCDHPDISAKLLRELIRSYEIGHEHIITTRYGKEVGLPVLFDRMYFDELLLLEKDQIRTGTIPKYSDDAACISYFDIAVGDKIAEDLTNQINA